MRILFVALLIVLRSSFAIASDSISSTSIDETEFRDAWSLSSDEYTQYKTYMATTGKLYYSHLDPLMVLGFITQDDSQRIDLARRHLELSRERFNNEVAFVSAVQRAQKQFFPRERAFNFANVSGYKKILNGEVANKSQFGNHFDLVAPPAQRATIASFNWSKPNTFTSIDIPYVTGCDRCPKLIQEALAATPTTVLINVFVDNQTVGKYESLLESLKNTIHPARVISTKRFDPILFTSTNPDPVIRQNGIAVATL